MLETHPLFLCALLNVDFFEGEEVDRRVGLCTAGMCSGGWGSGMTAWIV